MSENYIYVHLSLSRATELLPGLQLYNIPLGISGIDEGEEPHPFDLMSRHIADRTASVIAHLSKCFLNIVNLKGDMAETLSVRNRYRCGLTVGVFKYFKSRPAIAVSREQDVHPRELGPSYGLASKPVTTFTSMHYAADFAAFEPLSLP